MVTSKLIYSFSLILFGLLVGYAIEKLPDPADSRNHSLVYAGSLHRSHSSVDLRSGHRPGQPLLVHHYSSPGGRHAESALRHSFRLAETNPLTKLFS